MAAMSDMTFPSVDGPGSPERPDPFADVRIDRKRPAAAQVYDQLRALILALAVPPGATLARATLAERFGVSQMPVREALLKLEEEGLVDTFPQSATRVSLIDMQRVREARFLRLSIELEAVRTLADGGALDVRPVQAIVERQAALLGLGDIDGFAHADREMHRTLLRMAGVPGLWSAIRSRSGHLDRLRRLHLPTPGKAESVVEEHRGIVAAIAAGDPAAAQARMRQHLSGTVASVEALRDSYPGFIEA